MKGYKTCETELSPTIYDQTKNNTNYHNLSYEKQTRENCSYKANNRIRLEVEGAGHVNAQININNKNNNTTS